MKFLRSIGLAALLMVGASGAFAAPSVMDDSSGSAFGYRISFRADTADSERMVVTPVQCSVGVAHSGTGTVSLYQVATSATAAGSGTLVATFTASTTSPTTFSPGLPFLKAVASVASDGTLMTIRCSNTQITKTDGVDVLIGGEDGVADAANPNTSPIICPKANAACHYLSTTTGWWAATASNGESTTSWSSTQDDQLAYFMVQGRTDMTQRATYVTETPDECARLRQQDYLGVGGSADWFDCTNYGYTHLSISEDTFLTTLALTNESAWVTTAGCNFRVSTNDGTVIVGTEMNVPTANSTAFAAGEGVLHNINTSVSAGTSIQFQSEDGDNCPGGSSCICGAGLGFFTLELRGIPE